MNQITVKSPVNIAVIKYWGKLDEELIIPLNDSISGTLSTDELNTITTVCFGAEFPTDRMWLNGEEVTIDSNKRLVKCIDLIRRECDSHLSNYKLRIVSRNNFPTGAGLASSASGLACLMYALCQLYGIHDMKRISTFARMGSGSAIRSVYGGFVQWVKGHNSDTSISRQIVPADYWPQIRILVLVINDMKKDVSSTSGMQLTVATSALMKERLNGIDARVDAMIDAIKRRDFEKFAEITMRDSNQFHALCQDTWPPIRYMNDISWSIISLCHKYNEFHGSSKVAYTFDAGPNACIYLLDQYCDEFLQLVQTIYPPDMADNFIRGIKASNHNKLDANLFNAIKSSQIVRENSLRYVISTKIGHGPVVLQEDESLFDMGSGLPKV